MEIATPIEDKNIRILRRLSGLCGVSVPFTLNAVLVAGYFRMDNYLSFGQVVYFGLTGCVVYVFLTIIAYLDCKERDLTALEKDFCEGVLLNCNYQFSGTPSYYERVHRKLLKKEIIRDDHLVGRHLGNILYHIVIFQVLGFIGLLALSAVSAGLSLLFVQLIEVPGMMITDGAKTWGE